jgi:hypothetical protein
MTGWSAAANEPDQTEWAVSRRTSVENKRTRLGLLTTSTLLFKKENKEVRTGVWSSAVEGRTADSAAVKRINRNAEMR